MVLKRASDAVSGMFTIGGRNPIRDESMLLAAMYTERQKQFDDWFSLLSLEDILQQDNMESFVGNDPRTTWNMSNFLLQPKPLSHKIVTLDGISLTDLQKDSTGIIENYFRGIWISKDSQGVRRGNQSWFWNFIGYLLATGWFALPYFVDSQGKLFVDYWNPTEVFPDFSDSLDEGMPGLARIRRIEVNKARTLAKREGWEFKSNQTSGIVTEYQLWKKDDNRVLHGVSYDNNIAKEMTVTRNENIPILVGSVGGIPNTSTGASQTGHKLHQSTATKFVAGQSILETNSGIYRNLNRQMTYFQQTIRDAANPRVLERSSSREPIIKSPDEWYARGAFFHGGIQDSIDVIPMPGIPAELTNMMFQLRNQAQRGSYSDLAFGNVIQEVSSIILSQAADSARQLLFPYHTGVMYAISTITTDWFKTLIKNPGIRPENWPDIPIDMFDNTEIESRFSISIPGDLNNRILMAKQLNNNFQLPVDTIMELLMPEVPNAEEAIAKLDAENVRLHPSYQAIQLINSFDAAAAEADRAGDNALAMLFRTAASQMKQQIGATLTDQERLGQTQPTNRTVNSRLGR